MLTPWSVAHRTLKEWNGVFNDAKLTKAAGWTDNQISELIAVFDDPTITEIRYRVKSARPDMFGDLKQGHFIVIKRENVFKTMYTGDGVIRELLEGNNLDDIKKSTKTIKVEFKK